MELKDLLPKEKWVALEKEITKRSSLDANVFNTDGFRITDYKNWANRLCPGIKANNKGQSFICSVAHMNVAAQAEQAKGPIVEECDAGLLKMVLPIFINDGFVGAIGACGLLLDDGEVDAFLINKITEIPEEEVERLSNDIRTISAEEIASLIEFIQEEINSLLVYSQPGCQPQSPKDI